MTRSAGKDWRQEFGIRGKRAGQFFGSKDELREAEPEVPQAHVLRRAFDLLKLDGILCSDSSPLVYFRQVDEITKDEAIRLQKDFWNHGGTPIFVQEFADIAHTASPAARREGP